MKRTGKIVKLSIDTIGGDKFMIESVLFKVYHYLNMPIGWLQVFTSQLPVMMPKMLQLKNGLIHPHQNLPLNQPSICQMKQEIHQCAMQIGQIYRKNHLSVDLILLPKVTFIFFAPSILIISLSHIKIESKSSMVAQSQLIHL